MLVLNKLERFIGEWKYAGPRNALARAAQTLIAPPATLRPAPDTEFLSWLRFANPGMLSEGNIDAFDYVASKLPTNSPVLEIGSFCGLSTNAIRYFLKKHGRSVPMFTCDRWEFEAELVGDKIRSTDIKFADYREHCRSSFIRNTTLFSGEQFRPHTIELFSDDFFAAWRAAREMQDVFGRSVQLGGKFSFCYIDGNHTYDFAKRDFENCDAVLDVGGFLLFDDSADGSGWEVNTLVKQVAVMPQYELVSKSPNYLFRKLANGATRARES
jgi:Methyltransferase domain